MRDFILYFFHYCEFNLISDNVCYLFPGNQLQQVLTGPVISATMNLPLQLACSLLQQHVNAALQGQAANGKWNTFSCSEIN